MFFKKNLRKTDKLIMNACDNDLQGDSSVIDIRITDKEQLFSSYSYSGDKLNSEFSDYVLEKAKSVPIKADLSIKIHTSDDIDATETDQAVKSHFRSLYKEAKKDIKRITLISVIMTVLGIIALTALILINHFTDNLYITSIVEIAAWVFIWEAVDYFFLQRPVIKAKCILIQRIYTAKTEICKEDSASGDGVE